MKEIIVTRPPHIRTFLKHAWLDYRNLDGLTDCQVLKAWQYCHVATWLRRRIKDPAGYKHFAHHHILPQIATNENTEAINREFVKRGLNKTYTLVIDFL